MSRILKEILLSGQDGEEKDQTVMLSRLKEIYSLNKEFVLKNVVVHEHVDLNHRKRKGEESVASGCFFCSSSQYSPSLCKHRLPLCVCPLLFNMQKLLEVILIFVLPVVTGLTRLNSAVWRINTN